MSIKPPNGPWEPIKFGDKPKGNLAVYYSDDLGRLPVRWVTKPGDNKADPNIETGTYGLFTTCWRGMRSAAVRQGRPWLFFTSKWGEKRVLSGMYHLKWYASQPVGGERDYALAADDVHFVEDPIPLSRIDELCGTDYSEFFRGHRVVNNSASHKIIDLLEEQTNATEQHVEEIHRLERFNKQHSGFRHAGFGKQDQFSWEDAKPILAGPHPAAIKEDQSNQSPTGKWKCNACGEEVENKALLRKCRHCEAIGTLEAITDD